jgi:hypothetical protein
LQEHEINRLKRHLQELEAQRDSHQRARQEEVHEHGLLGIASVALHLGVSFWERGDSGLMPKFSSQSTG